MINGVHLLLYSRDPEADRAFFRDVLGFQSVDAGGGWLIFALPPAELATHPGDDKFVELHADHEPSGGVVYLMCDDLRATMESVQGKAAKTTEIVEPGGGSRRRFDFRVAADEGSTSRGMLPHWVSAETNFAGTQYRCGESGV